MTTIGSITFEVSPDNTVLTEANTGYSNIGATVNTFRSDNSVAYVGTFCGLCTMTAADNLFGRIDAPATTSVGSNSGAFYAESLPAANTSLLWFAFNGTSRGSVRILSDGTFQMRQGTSAIWDAVTNGNGTKLIPLHWYHCELIITATTLRLIITDENNNQLENATVAYSGGTWNQYFGGSSASNAWNLRIDSHIATDSTTPTGPRVVNTNWTRSVSDALGPADSVSSGLIGFIFQTDFEVGTDGSNYTAGMLGYSNLTGGPWEVDGTQLAYNGTRSAFIDLVNANAQCSVPFALAQDHVYHGLGSKWATLPSVETTHMQLKDAASVITTQIRMLPTGVVRMLDGNTGATEVWRSPAPVITLTGVNKRYYWIEHSVEADLDRQKCQVFDYAGNLIVDSDWQTYSGGQLASANMGIVANATCQVNLDRHRIAIVTQTGPLINPNDFAQNITDVEGLSDAAINDRFKIITDSLGLSDGVIVTSSLQFAQSANDSVGLADASVAVNVKSVSISDTMNLFQDDVLQTNVADVFTDALGITDGVVANKGSSAATIDDPAGMADSIVQNRSIGALLDALGLSDSSLTTVQGTTTNKTNNDSENLTDAIVAGITGKRLDDPLNLSDLFSTNLYSLDTVVTNGIGITDSLSSRLNGNLVGSFSEQDLVYFFLRNRGYTGSIQDMQYAYLRDIYIATFGSLPTGYTMSSADFQHALGFTVEELIQLANDWSRIQTDSLGLADAVQVAQTFAGGNSTRSVDDAEGLTDSLSFVGDLFPGLILSNNSQTAGSSKSTATWTPGNIPAARRVYLVVASFLTATAAIPTTVTGNSLTWHLVSNMSGASTNGNVTFSVWAATTAGGSTGPITMDWNGVSQTAFAWALFEAPGIKLTATQADGCKQTSPTPVQSASTTPAVSLTTNPATANLRVGVIAYNAANSQSCVPEAGWTALVLIQLSSNSLQLSISIDQGAADQSSGWTTGNAGNKVLGVMELEAA